jgi:transcriptional regulator of acetoin/glycerol metabolism
MNEISCATFPDIAISNLFNTISHGIVVVDWECRIVAINQTLEALTWVLLADAAGLYVDFVLRSNIARTKSVVVPISAPVVIEQPQPPPRETGKDWQAIEKQMIVLTQTQTRGNRSKAAALLGWGWTTLWRKLKTHGLVSPSVPCDIKEEA